MHNIHSGVFHSSMENSNVVILGKSCISYDVYFCVCVVSPRILFIATYILGIESLYGGNTYKLLNSEFSLFFL